MQRIKKKTARFLPIVAFLLFLGFFGFGSLGTNLWSGTPVPPTTIPGFLNGTWRHQLEQWFDKGLPLKNSLVAAWQTLVYQFFNQGLPGLIVGQEGWLFTREEWYSSPLMIDEPITWESIEQIHEQLSLKEINLVIVPLPGKNRVLSANHSQPLPAELENRYSAFLSGLESRNILFVDLYHLYTQHPEREQLFFRTDTHWTPLGAQKAAQAAAHLILAQPWVQNLQQADFTSVSQKKNEHRGDLFEFLPPQTILGNWLPRKLPEPDSLTLWETTMTQGPSLGLFDTPEIPLALVGTSYSANEQWNFLGFLQEFLSMDGIPFAAEGRGPLVPMRQALDNPVIQEVGVRVVIWEIPERYLCSSVYSQGGNFNSP